VPERTRRAGRNHSGKRLFVTPSTIPARSSPSSDDRSRYRAISQVIRELWNEIEPCDQWEPPTDDTQVESGDRGTRQSRDRDGSPLRQKHRKHERPADRNQKMCDAACGKEQRRRRGRGQQEISGGARRFQGIAT
jgi:hypothetical protein